MRFAEISLIGVVGGQNWGARYLLAPRIRDVIGIYMQS
jgi:hypothetical protein